MADQLDPWTIERAKRPGEALFRFINLETDEQQWICVVPRQPDRTDFLPEYELDGLTLIFPWRNDRTEAERAHLIALYDELWREQQQAANQDKRWAA